MSNVDPRKRVTTQRNMKMGKAIQSKWFGRPVGAGSGNITVDGVMFSDGSKYTSAYIIKQTGSSAYLVQDSARLHAAEIVFLANATSVNSLTPGHAFILATPFGGSAVPVAKISQFRLDTFNTSGGATSYRWSGNNASALGQASLIKQGVSGQVLTVEISNGGGAYISVPSVSFTGGGSGALATAVVTAGVVTAINVTSAGSGYTGTGVSIASPQSPAIQATAHATVSGGGVSAVGVTIGGQCYPVAPIVTITGDGTGAHFTANVSGGGVVSYTQVSAGTGYTTASVSVAAPQTPVQATAVAVIS